MSSDLLHEALHRATLNQRDRDAHPRSPPLGSSMSAGSSDAGRDDHEHEHDASDDEYDNQYTPVHTRPGTPSGTPRGKSHFSSFPSSASRGSGERITPAGSRSTSPSRLAKKRMAEEAERRASRDPLVRFDNEITSRIFRDMDVATLARCMRVSKRWRRSATINWAWFLRFTERRDEAPLASREPVWTRKDAKEDWSRRYRSAFTMNGLQYSTAFEMEYEKARSDGYRTPKEEREAQWANEASSSSTLGNGGLASFGGDKAAAREFYKGLGGRTKVKSKGAAGSVTGVRDRTAFGEDDYY